MPIRDYPFIAIGGGGSLAVGTKEGRPRLWIRVTNPHSGMAIETAAIVDTGADDCLFPAEIALRLGHDLEAMPPIPIGTANKITYAYAHTTRIDILGVLPDGQADKKKILFTVGPTHINYAKGLDQFLLGRRNFLDQFILVINYPRRQFTIRKPQSSNAGQGHKTANVRHGKH